MCKHFLLSHNQQTFVSLKPRILSTSQFSLSWLWEKRFTFKIKKIHWHWFCDNLRGCMFFEIFQLQTSPYKAVMECLLEGFLSKRQRTFTQSGNTSSIFISSTNTRTTILFNILKTHQKKKPTNKNNSEYHWEIKFCIHFSVTLKPLKVLHLHPWITIVWYPFSGMTIFVFYFVLQQK